MKNRIIRREWAHEKVLRFVEPCKEKSTLLVIAHHADPDGRNSWPGIHKIAMESGHNVRTVKRHIKVLIEKKLLIRTIGGHGKYDTSKYSIPICIFTLTQLEEMHHRPAVQLGLPLVRRAERTDNVVTATGAVTPDWAAGLSTNALQRDSRVTDCPSKGDNLSSLGCQTDSQPSLDHSVTNWLGDKEKNGSGSVDNLRAELPDRDAVNRLAQIDPDLARKVEKLRRRKAGGVTIVKPEIESAAGGGIE